MEKKIQKTLVAACVLRSLDEEFALKRAVLFTRRAYLHSRKNQMKKLLCMLASVDSAEKEHEPTCPVK